MRDREPVLGREALGDQRTVAGLRVAFHAQQRRGRVGG